MRRIDMDVRVDTPHPYKSAVSTVTNADCSDSAETTHDANRFFKAIDIARLYFLPGYGAGR